MLIRLRFRFSEVFFGALLTVAIFAMGMLFEHAPSENVPTPNRANENQSEPQDGGAWNWLTHDATGIFTGFLVVVGGIQIAVFLRQLSLIRESLIDAKKAARAAQDSADAAKLNAQALINSESAQMYVIMGDSNIESLFQIGQRKDGYMDDAADVSTPWIKYQLRNYGKSPAILNSVFDGISIENPDIPKERIYQARQAFREIIGIGQQTREDQLFCKYTGKFTFKDAQFVARGCRMFFYGHATFRDNFDRIQTLEWEFVAEGAEWRLVEHRADKGAPKQRNG
jgi:hypothetical protein